MLHLPPAHHETSKCDSPNEAKMNEKQKKTILNSNSNLTKSMTHQNQTKELTTWFLRLSLENNSLWIIMDRLVKVAHFVPINTAYTRPQLAGLYSSRVAYFHGVPIRIVFDRETQVISKLWERFYETMATHLNLSSAYYPQTDGQTERVNQILEDMLRACALQYGRSRDKSLSYVEFSYNNSYQESLKMAPFEMLYGQRCRTMLFWSEAGEWKVFGPNILQEAEKQVHMVRENL
jgi:hypothetical protein